MHPKQQKHINKDYLTWIKTKQCLICAYPAPIDAHHVWNSGGKHGNDYLTIPLCRLHHTDYHAHGVDTFAINHNIDYWHEIVNRLSQYIEEKV